MNRKDNVKVRIMIPTYNCVDKVDETIQSITGQTFAQENIELSLS